MQHSRFDDNNDWKKNDGQEDNVDKEQQQEGANYNNNDDDDCKIFVSRVPSIFTKESIHRLLEEKLGLNSVSYVALKYQQKEQKENDEEEEANDIPLQQEQEEEHRGFGFVTLSSSDLVQTALKLKTVRGTAKPNSTKRFSFYIRPILRDSNNHDTTTPNASDERQICFLLETQKYCPYGKDCKFFHPPHLLLLQQQQQEKKEKPPKPCFNFRKNGKCKWGNDCPYSHNVPILVHHPIKKDKQEKDCIEWKTKGKCRRIDSCPYRHDPTIQQLALDKQKKRAKQDKKKKKKQQSTTTTIIVHGYNNNKDNKDKTVKEKHIRALLESCGTIVDSSISLPNHAETSNDDDTLVLKARVIYQSPKAVTKAMERHDGTTWQGIKLHITLADNNHNDDNETGRQREQNDEKKRNHLEAPQLGEFGQRVKRRKRHGFDNEHEQ